MSNPGIEGDIEAPPGAAQRVALVTGASTGIGRALALALARRGWTVAAAARSAGRLDDLAREAHAALPGGAGRIVACPLDVTDAAANVQVVARIEDTLGPIALAVFNAGTHAPDSARDLDPAAFRALLEINFLGTVNGLAAVVPRMRARRQGRIGVVASVTGYRGLPSAGAYGASKAALINLCEALRPELDRDGICLSVINPGFVRTPLTDRNDFPMPFLMEADDAAERIVRGLETRRFEIVFPRRFAWLLKLAGLLPDALYFAMTRRLLR
jgi:NAD(P)-dependent dehydrogenase (short-subunit alcohol dehydrogenase family)